MGHHRLAILLGVLHAKEIGISSRPCGPLALVPFFLIDLIGQYRGDVIGL